MAQRLLQTKFHIPTPRQADLPRPALFEVINAGIEQRHKLTLVSAPAGYGKTTLIAGWCDALSPGCAVAWLSLDERDNDPVRFLYYWIAAFQRVTPDMGQSIQSLLSMPQPPPLQALVDELLNDLMQLDCRVYCVLDDYHAIRQPEIHAALDYFLEYLPETTHLLMTTREDPPLALPRLRVRRQITEIRAQMLRFSPAETRAFLKQTAGLDLDSHLVTKLVARTEGWAAGLQLAGLALQNLSDPDDFLSDFNGSHRYVIDYLLDEVLSQQTKATRSFLMSTAHLSRFNAGLAEAVTGDPQAGERLQALARANLFLVPLDDHRGWYRYHQLFADVICANAPAGTAEDVLPRAAEWLETNQFLGEAIDTWLAAGQPDEAARLIKISASESLRFGEIQTLLGWLESLPYESRQSDLALSAFYALCLMLTGQLDLAQTHLEKFASLKPAPAAKPEHGPFLAVQAWLASTSGSSKTGKLAEEALAALDESAPFFRIMALLALGGYFAWNNDLTESSVVFRQAYQLSQAIETPFTSMGALANLAFNLLELGQLREAETLCQAALREKIDSQGNPLPILGIIYSPLAAICYEKGDFDQARIFAEKAINLSKRLFSSQILGGDAEVVLSRVAFARDHNDQALDILHTTAEAARQRPVPIVQYKMAVAETELYLLAGRQADAQSSLRRLEALTPAHLLKAQQITQHLQARVLILTDKPDQALSILDQLILEDPAQTIGRRLMGLHLSRALALQKQGKNDLAENAFETSLQLAAREGYQSLFLPCEGRQTLLLLQECKNAAPAFVEDILDLAGVNQGQAAALLPEPLTEQEQRVLRFLAAGKSNQEIAEALVVSVGTAKWHVHNILTKLNVGNRVEAAARARDLGIV